jgi:hypothetical protein
MDTQSPARLDFLDRLRDGDSPHSATLGRVGAYRPQELSANLWQPVPDAEGGPADRNVILG